MNAATEHGTRNGTHLNQCDRVRTLVFGLSPLASAADAPADRAAPTSCMFVRQLLDASMRRATHDETARRGGDDFA